MTLDEILAELPQDRRKKIRARVLVLLRREFERGVEHGRDLVSPHFDTTDD